MSKRQAPAPPSIPLVSVRQLAALLGVSTDTIIRRRNDPAFPAPIRISSRCVRYDPVAVRRYFEQRGADPAAR